MTTPTQAQIEAASKAIENKLPKSLIMIGHELAKAALTAAAQVGPITTEQLDIVQFGRVLHKRPTPIPVNLPFSPDNVPAAQVGELDNTGKLRREIHTLRNALATEQAATIERCKQVVEANEWMDGTNAVTIRSIIAALDKLKDEP